MKIRVSVQEYFGHSLLVGRWNALTVVQTNGPNVQHKIKQFSNLEQCIIQISRFDRLRKTTTLLLNNLAQYTHVFFSGFLLQVHAHVRSTRKELLHVLHLMHETICMKRRPIVRRYIHLSAKIQTYVHKSDSITIFAF